MQLSIVQFDEKTPMELMETLNEILKYLDKKSNDVRIRDESPEALFQRIGDFLHVLGSHFTHFHESTVVKVNNYCIKCKLSSLKFEIDEKVSGVVAAG